MARHQFRRMLCLIGLCQLFVITRVSAQPFVYVANVTSNTVTIIDGASNLVIGSIVVGNNPEEVALTPDGKRAYVTCGTFDAPASVAVVDTSTNVLLTSIPMGFGTFPRGIAITPDGKRAYVSNATTHQVSVINTDINSIVSTINVGNFPLGVAVTPDGAQVYVANSSSNNISVIDSNTNTVVNTIPAGTQPHNLVFTPDGKRVYVGNFTAPGSVSVIDIQTSSVSTIATGNFTNWVAITPDGSRVYATNAGSNSVSVIDTSTNSVVGTVGVGLEDYGIALTSDGKTAYVAVASTANPPGNSVWVIDTTSNTVSATVSLAPGIAAFGLAVTQQQRQFNVCLLYDSSRAVHSGSTIPIKLQLCDAAGIDVSSSSIAVHAVNVTMAATSISGLVDNSGNSNPDSDFRFDSSLGTSGGYIFTLKTTGLETGTYSLNFKAGSDPFIYSAPFQVK